MAKLPCPPQSRIYTLKDTGETMSYDQVREYLMSNPELWQEGKAERRKIGGKKVESKKADPILAALYGENAPKSFKDFLKKLGEKFFVHGTKSDFTKYDLKKAGTGEGMAAYGNGMYVGDDILFINNEYAKNFGEGTNENLYLLPKKGLKIITPDQSNSIDVLKKIANEIKSNPKFSATKGATEIADNILNDIKNGDAKKPYWAEEYIIKLSFDGLDIYDKIMPAIGIDGVGDLRSYEENRAGQRTGVVIFSPERFNLIKTRLDKLNEKFNQIVDADIANAPEGPLSSVEATAKALGEKVKKISSVDAFVEPKESEIKNGNTFNLIRGNVYEGKGGVGQSKNIFGATLADALPSLFGDSDKRRISKLENAISEYEKELSDSKTDAQRKNFIEGQLEPLRYELNKIKTDKEDFEKTSKENEQLGLVWLTSQKDTAKSYAEQLTNIPDALRGERPLPSVNYDQVQVTPKKIFDLASLTDEVGNVYESGNAKKITDALGIDIDNLPESVQYAYQLFRGKNAKPVVQALINKGYDVVKLNESGQDNFILLNAPHLKDTPQSISEAYHAAKKDGSNPELVKAVEDLLGEKAEGKPLTPEQELKQAFDKWKSETGKLGIVPNWERQAKADIELFNAAKKYLLTKIGQGAYAFEQFLKDLAKAKVENIDEDRSKWKKFYDDTINEAAPAEEGKAATPPPPVTPPPPTGKREMPEGEGKETEKPILGRAFRGTTDEAIAEKIVQIGLYRTPANIAEAFEVGQELVSTLGTDKAIELGTKGEVPNGLVRIGVLKAVLADINKQRDALKIGEGTKGEEMYMNSLDELNDKYAQALAAFSPSLTESGQVLRAWQEVVQSAEFEFDYEGRKTRYKTLFGDEAYTKEVDERFKEYDKKLKDAAKKRKELENRIAELEAQGIVDNINQEKKTSPVSFFKQAAERVRKLKLSRPGIFSAATPASLAWDATIEAVAVVLEASGTIEEAIAAGVKKLKTTNWYKSLTDAKKKEAEEQFSSNVKDTYILKATVDENGKIQIPSGLLRSYVTSGVKDANAIINDILSYLKEENPEIIEADVRAAILEVGKKEAPKSAEITKNVNTLKTIIRMIGQLEQVQQGKRITKGEGKQKEMDKTIKNLKKQIEQLHIEQFGVKPGALTDEQRLANIKKNALKRIADMKAMQPRPEPREKVKWDAEMSRIANEEFRLKEKWNEEFREAERKKRGAMQKFFRGAFLAVNFSKTIMTGIGDLGVLLIQGSILPFRSASVTKEAIANMGRAFLSQEAYVEQLRKINESELYRVLRKSGLDLPQITSLEIERVEEATLGALGETIFDVMFLPFKYVPKIGPKMYEWAKTHINPARVFNRTQTSYMNTLRYGSFALSAQNLMEKGITYEDNPKSYKDVAAMINTMTGRTKVIGEESAAVMRGLNLVFYSPKNWASVIKMFSPVILYHVGKRRADSVGVLGMSEAQQTFIRTYASWVATSAALMFLIKAISDSEDEDEEKKREAGNVSVDWENPQSSAFNKIRIGNQIFDPWGGKQQIITLQARMIIHFMGGRAFKEPYTGIEKTLEETPRFKHPLGLMSEYAKGKFAPYMSAVVKLLSSQKAKGREWYVRQSEGGGPTFNLLDPVSESYTNITYNAVKDLYSNQPLTISEVMTLFLIAGGGITTLNDQEAKTIVSQIREQINPGEDEKRRYAANMASRLKDGDVEGAATVYDEAMGIKGVADKRKIVSLRREGGDKMYESASKDVVAQRYGVDDMFRKYLLQVVYENKPISISSSMSEKKKQVLSALNALTPEQKQEVKLDYDYRYEELMNVAKGIDKLTSQPNKYEKRAGRESWVKQYKKATGKK